MSIHNERKKRDTSKKHNDIIQGAIRVFINQGYELANMDEIAIAANVSKRTIYNHFESKEMLLQAVVRYFLRARQSLRPVKYDSSSPLENQLLEFIEAELYLVNDPIRRGLSRFLTSYFLIDISFASSLQEQQPPQLDFIKWFEEAVRDQRLYGKSATLAARIFYGMIEGCLTWPALMSHGESLKQSKESIPEIIQTFLSRYQYDEKK